LKKSKFHCDQDLLVGLTSCSGVIINEYYILYYENIKRFVLYNKGTEEDAKDLFQDVLLVIFQKVRKGQLELTCSLSTFIYSISRFLWLKELEKRKRISHKLTDIEEYIDVDADIIRWSEYNERLYIYRKIFDALSRDCQRVLSLFLEGLTIAGITKIMGYKSEQYTKNRRYRCKMFLIKKVQNYYNKKE
jgi:RNA polymerase sigma factor (sigma-70 family)